MASAEAIRDATSSGNTPDQEDFIRSLTTSGALDEGSGFVRQFYEGETYAQYESRLDAWKTNRYAPTTAATRSVTGEPGRTGRLEYIETDPNAALLGLAPGAFSPSVSGSGPGGGSMSFAPTVSAPGVPAAAGAGINWIVVLVLGAALFFFLNRD